MRRIIALILTIVMTLSAMLLLSSCAKHEDKLTEEEGTEGLEYYPLADGTYGVKMGMTQYLETVKIPSTYNGKAVTQILDGAFQNAVSLKNISIPDSVTSVGDYAFQGCVSLTTESI